MGTHRGQSTRVAVGAAITVSISRNLLETTVHVCSPRALGKKKIIIFWLELQHYSAVGMPMGSPGPRCLGRTRHRPDTTC